MKQSTATKSTIKKIPILGKLMVWSNNIINAPHTIKTLQAELLASKAALSTLQKTSASSQQDLADQISKVNHRATSLQHSLNNLATPANKQINNSGPGLFADDHSLDSFYLDFENKFRGTEAEIEQRLEFYIPKIKSSALDFDKFPLIDLGCGRGEMLNIMKKNNINAIGVDANQSMVDRSNQLGYNVKLDDAIGFLEKQADNSLGAITAFHLVEHIPFQQLIRLFNACHRALTPGGFVIFETPNPENLRVGAWTFYMDPSHLNPLPPSLLEFAIQSQGFGKTEVIRLHPMQELEQNDDLIMNEVKNRLFGAQDYSVIGYKQ